MLDLVDPRTSSDAELPEFDRPPVVETILAAQFDASPEISTADLGAFWSTVRGDWPVSSDLPPVPSQTETFSENAWREAVIRLQFSTQLITRVQLKSAKGNESLQLQPDRLMTNWVGEGVNYPRYSHTRPAFFKAWKKWLDFLDKSGKRPPKVNQWEVTYVNHIPKGDLWQSTSDLCGVMRLISSPSDEMPGELESLNWQTRFALPEKSGRLHIDVGAISVEDSEVLRVTLTARGPIKAPAEADAQDVINDLGRGFDLGRQSIVCGFTAITTVDAHKIWGRKK